MATLPSDAQPGRLKLSVLHLDPYNPRLPEDIQESDENSLLQFIAETYNAIEIGRSIARFGYFESEPLIVVSQEDGTHLVVEGNRRLVALRLLEDPSLASDLDDAAEWEVLAQGARLPETIPVIIAPDRNAVFPVVGYRHISGIEPWEPHEKARFIAHLVDDQGLSFEEVANVVGENKNDVAALYRNYAIVTQAQRDFDIDARRATKRFGVFTRAMNSWPLRTFIGIPPPSQVSPGQQLISEGNAPAVQELFSWLFGDDEGHEAVISESRGITDLGVAVDSEVGLQILRDTRSLNEAFIAAGGLHERLLRRLNNAYTNLAAARDDIAEYINDEDVQSLLERCDEALRRLRESNEAS